VLFFSGLELSWFMPKIRIEAPAKLNLYLHIGGKRPDGFHEIESLFLALAFGDVLHFETTQSADLSLEMDWQLPGFKSEEIPRIPPEKNIISRAVSLFRGKTGYDMGLKIAVEKKIPPGGGLGGGSSDAAAALLALNRLASPGGKDGHGLLDDAALAEMGASLGSDVPFFLCNAPIAQIGGRGELVRPLELPESICSLSIVLVCPGFSSNTTEAYNLYDEYTDNNNFIPYKTDSLLRFLSDSPKKWQFTNDFSKVFKAKSPSWASYLQIFSCLRELQADFMGLSGSGSSCFGVFSDREIAIAAQESLKKQWSFVIVTFPLAYRAIQYYNSGNNE
jgi:4-diphosphocytidyl-2-C-methyl-D-erythritol kinase